MLVYSVLLSDASIGNEKFKDQDGRYEAIVFAGDPNQFVLFDSDDDYLAREMGTVVDRTDCDDIVESRKI